MLNLKEKQAGLPLGKCISPLRITQGNKNTKIMIKDFKCVFETKKGTEVEFIFAGRNPEQAKFYIAREYVGAKKIVVKEIK
jgi:hypothetical protein